MAGTISFPGMSSSQDFNSIIDALVAARRKARIEPLEKWQTQWEEKREVISGIDSTLSSFYTTVRSMDRLSEFLVRQASSSATSVLSASASSKALTGTHSIIVNQLAQAENEVHTGIQNSIQYHAGVDDKTASINSSGAAKTFKYSYNGTKITISVADGDTLETLVASINSDPSNPGVTAKIVTSDSQDHLVLVETSPDKTKAIVIDPDSDMTLDGTDSTVNLTSSTFTQTVNASGSAKVFQIKYGTDAAVDISVPTGTTVTGLRDLINAAAIGVTASVLDDGGTGSGSIHLVLRGQDTGSTFTILLNSGSGTTLNGTLDTEDFTDGAGIFTETASAQDAQIRVDGFPSGTYITRSTNVISDVIDGVTLTLAAAGTSTVTVTTDTDSILEKVEEFKDAFNAVRSAIIEATKYDAETGKAGTLLGNYALQIIKLRLDSLVSSAAPGFQDPDDAYISLGQVGFSTDTQDGSETEGLLILDTSVLSSALASNPDAVADLFASYLDGLTDSTDITFTSSLYTATAGTYDVEIDTVEEKGRFKIQGGDWRDWVALSGTSGNYTLTGVSGPERGIALSVKLASGTGTHTAQLRLKNGVIAEISNELENLLSTSGPLNTLDTNYAEIESNIEKRVSEEERRLALYEEMLQLRFARLDSYITTMTQIGNFLTSYSQSRSSGNS